MFCFRLTTAIAVTVGLLFFHDTPPSAAEPTAPSQTTRPPNIVLLVADDLGINDLACYGRVDHKTPALDRLAAQGVRFESAYSAASICSPSRAAILTGQHPARLNITTFLPGRSDRSSHRLLSTVILNHLPDGVTTLPTFLKPLGYSSTCIGKWHLGGSGHGATEHGFDTFMVGHANPGAESFEGGKGELGNAAAAATFIDAHVSKPFFLYVAFNNPHIPLDAKAQLVKANADTFHPLYAATVQSLDTAVAAIMDALDRNHLADNTLVIFTSDNGGLHVPEGRDAPPTFNAPYRAGKGFLYEGGIRVPLIIRLPGRCTPGLIVDSPVSLGDLVPTICGLTGAHAPNPCDFENITPLLSVPHNPPPAERTFYWHQPHSTNQGGRPAGAIRVGHFKLIEHYDDGRLELFHCATDRSEEHDVSAVDPGRVAALRGLLEAWRRRVGAPFMQANPHFDPNLWAACYTATDVSLLKPAATAAAMVLPLRDWQKAMNSPATARPLYSDALIRLEARDATVVGEKLRYENQPEKDTLGYWVNPTETAFWECTIETAGVYQVSVLAGCGKGNGGSTVSLVAGEESIQFEVEETGHFQRFVPYQIGQLSLVAGKNKLVVQPVRKKAAAVMDLRRIQLERMTTGVSER